MPATASVPKRNYYVSGHAITRFLQRANDTSDVSRDLAAAIIDRAVTSAVAARRFKDIIEDDRPEKLVDLTADLNEPLWAIVKENRPRIEPYNEAISSILNREQVESSNGKWRYTDDRSQVEPPRIPLATLGDKMLDKQLPVKPPTAETRLISWIDEKSVRHFEEYTTDQVQKTLEGLYQNPSVVRGSVRLYREIKFKTRLVVEEE